MWAGFGQTLCCYLGSTVETTDNAAVALSRSTSIHSLGNACICFFTRWSEVVPFLQMPGLIHLHRGIFSQTCGAKLTPGLSVYVMHLYVFCKAGK